MKKFSFIAVFIAAFFISGCQDKLNQLNANELLEIAHNHYEKGNYNDVIDFLENFELRFPVHKQVPKSVYTRAMAYYQNASYAQAFAVFEVFLDRYPLNEERINVQKYMFYCFYNQITHYERDYSLIEKACEYSKAYKQLAYKDEIFEQALKKLNLFIAHNYLKNIYSSLDTSPKLWVRMLWIAHTMIKEHAKNPETAEAYYRIIEFLCAQKNYNAHMDARLLLTQMQEYHANTQWYEMAKMCIENEAKVDSSENVVVEISNLDQAVSDNSDVEGGAAEENDEMEI